MVKVTHRSASSKKCFTQGDAPSFQSEASQISVLSTVLANRLPALSQTQSCNCNTSKLVTISSQYRLKSQSTSRANCPWVPLIQSFTASASKTGSLAGHAKGSGNPSSLIHLLIESRWQLNSRQMSDRVTRLKMLIANPPKPRCGCVKSFERSASLLMSCGSIRSPLLRDFDKVHETRPACSIAVS